MPTTKTKPSKKASTKKAAPAKAKPATKTTAKPGAPRPPVYVALKHIRLDGDLQARVSRDETVIRDYASVWEAGTGFPPVKLLFDGTDYWPWDGEHRILSALKVGKNDIEAEVKPGTQRDAMLLALSANQHHGLRRTNADKRNAVERMLRDEEWRGWSNRKIADHIGVSDPFVGKMRDEIYPPEVAAPTPASQPNQILEKVEIVPPTAQSLEPTPAESERDIVKRNVSAKFFSYLSNAEESGITEEDWTTLAGQSETNLRKLEDLMLGGADLASALAQIAAPKPAATPKAPTAKKADPKPAAEPEKQTLGGPVARIEKVLGDEFTKAQADGRIPLTVEELSRYADELGDDAELKAAAGAIQAGWKIDRYRRVSLGHVDRQSKVDDLINKCVASNGRCEVEVGSFLFTVEKR